MLAVSRVRDTLARQSAGLLAARPQTTGRERGDGFCGL